MISIDGFRHDYLKKYAAPHLRRLAKNGVHVEGLFSTFPSKTFPNHYSIITGLHAGRHGLVANHFYDPKVNRRYTLRDRKEVQDGFWYGGTPLWVAARQQGMVSASYFWVGSEAPIQGLTPDHWYPFSSKTSVRQRTRQVIKWLKWPPEKRPHFITLYFEHVDSKGHSYGPDAPETGQAVSMIDTELGWLFTQLGQLDLKINIIVVSDHGMTLLDRKKRIDLSRAVDTKDREVRIVGQGPGDHLRVPPRRKN